MFRDVDGISEESLANRLEKIQNEALERFLSVSDEEKMNSKEIDDRRMMARKEVIDNKDSIAMERILGDNDLVPIAYLLQGYKVGNSVCKIMIRNRVGNTVGSGTGFLIAPNLIITNNHVLPNFDSAILSVAQFNFQNDENFIPEQDYIFQLEPDKFFITDELLDFTIVAVKDESYDGKSVDDFGFIRLLANNEKIIEGEYVSIIQHPKGRAKSVTLRENQVSSIFDNYIHYMTDTQPGSSGSPVFNDQWVVVALHHAGVPNPDKSGEWIANEGIRISSIVKYIRDKYASMDATQKKVLREAFPEVFNNENEKNERVCEGYNPTFLGSKYRIDLPKLSEDMKADLTKMEDGNFVLDYTHFSIVMCKSRGLAYFTGVNIDGKTKVDIRRGVDKWKFDNRISEEHQYGNAVYKNNKLDRGHLVKRTDPNWGEDAYQANEDTFHYTNSAPQHEALNRKTWLSLEDYILSNAHNNDLKISVFTGPVLKNDDIPYRDNFKIPEEFWKVVVMVKDNGELSATAYLQTQEDMIGDLEFVYGEFETYQVPLSLIEKKTGLDFGMLSEYDPIASIESSVLLITDESSIRI